MIDLACFPVHPDDLTIILSLHPVAWAQRCPHLVVS